MLSNTRQCRLAALRETRNCLLHGPFRVLWRCWDVCHVYCWLIQIWVLFSVDQVSWWCFMALRTAKWKHPRCLILFLWFHPYSVVAQHDTSHDSHEPSFIFSTFFYLCGIEAISVYSAQFRKYQGVSDLNVMIF